ncbi:hypothetical protein V8C34DRAFT_313570 [Trichoderma compactum]
MPPRAESYTPVRADLLGALLANSTKDSKTKKAKSCDSIGGEDSNLYATTLGGMQWTRAIASQILDHICHEVTSWKVISYQIPVPIGDCSAHFLVDAKTRHVHKAFLMDGGMDAGNYATWAQILKGLHLLVNPGIEFTRCKHDEATITKSSPKNFASLYLSSAAVLSCGAWDAHSSKDLRVAKKGGKHGEELLRCIWGEKLIGLDLFTRCFCFDRVTGQPDYKKAPEIFSIPPIADASQNTPRFCVVGANGFGSGQLGASQRDVYPCSPILARYGNVLVLHGRRWTSGCIRGPVQTWFNSMWPNGDVEMAKLDHRGSTRENLAEASGIKKEGQNNTANNGTEQKRDTGQPSTSDTGLKMEDKLSIGLVVTDMKPSKVLVTPGSRHGHPTWDVLIVLRHNQDHSMDFQGLSNVSSNQVPNNKQVQGLFMTRSVYWLSKDEENSDMSIEKDAQNPESEKKGAVNYGGDSPGMSIEHDEYVPDNEGNMGSSRGGDSPDMSVEHSPYNSGNEDNMGSSDGEDDVKKDAMGDEVILKIGDNQVRATAQKQAQYYTESGNLRKDAVDLDVARATHVYQLERWQKVHGDEELEQGSLEEILYKLVLAFHEIREAFDDAQLEGVEDFRKVCWQLVVGSEHEDPHFLVFDDSGGYEYEYMEKSEQVVKEEGEQGNKAEGRQEEGKQEDIQRFRKIETGIFAEDKQKPWAKYAYGDCAIASMLCPESLWTLANSKMILNITGEKGNRKEKNKKNQREAKTASGANGNMNINPQKTTTGKVQLNNVPEARKQSPLQKNQRHKRS